MKRFLFLLTIAGTLTFVGCEKNDETADAPLVHQSETITVSTTWGVANNPHTISGTVIVNGAVLTIEPGTIIKFEAGASLIVRGENASLIAVGTKEKPIKFTSVSMVPAPGDWNYIRFETGAVGCRLEYCDVEYGGNNISAGMIDVKGSALVSVKSCNFSNAKYSAIEADDQNGFVEFVNNFISSKNAHAMRLLGDNVRTIGSGNGFQVEGNYGVLVTGAAANYVNITKSATWPKLSVPYFVEDEMIVKGGATLTLSPGVVVKLMDGVSMKVGYSGENGTFIAKGTAADSVYITSASSTPQAGDWNYLMFQQGAVDCELAYCRISYGGGNSSWGMIDVEGNALLSVTNCVLYNAQYVAVEAEDNGNGFVAFENNTLNGTEGQHLMKIRGMNVSNIGDGNNFKAFPNFGILVTGSSSSYNYVTQSATWKAHNAPYYIDDDIMIQNGAVLTIEAGATFKFLSAKKMMVGSSTNGGGKLMAVGTTQKPIVFTSASATPQKGDWRGIEFSAYAVSGCELNYCNINFAGGSKANVDVYPCGAGNPLIHNSEIGNSKFFGVYLRKSGGIWASPTLTSNSMHDNLSGDQGQDS